MFTGAKNTQITEITGKKGLFLGPFFSLSHTRLGCGARDWGQMLTTLVILRTLLRTLYSCPLSLSLSLPLIQGLVFLSFHFDSAIRE